MLPEIDVTQRLLAGYSKIAKEELKRNPPAPPVDLHPQAAEMLAWMAAHAVHKIDKGTDAYLDYTVPVIGLALTYCLVVCEHNQAAPDFSRPSRPDTWVHAAFSRQVLAELNREQRARLQQGVWRCYYDSDADVAHHRLTRHRRASALMLLNAQAQSALLQLLIGRALSTLSLDELSHALASGREMLHFVTRADPVGWSKFEQAIHVDESRIAALSGFLVFLEFAAGSAKHSFWYDDATLIKLWNLYVEVYPQYGAISGQSMVEAISEFSMAPSHAASTLIHPPFYLLHGRFLRNPCFAQGKRIVAGLLTIAIRRHENAWNNTLGSTLARAADVLKSLLPELKRLKVAVRRKIPDGDVDLALYDTNTGEMLICEVKTVYDKHNVDSLTHQFQHAKVNLDRAASQLAQVERSISSGQVTMQSLFGEKLVPPKAVHKVLLTWIDPIDLTMGTKYEEILCMNFSIFLALVHSSGGDMHALAVAVRELRNLWLVAHCRPLDLGQPELTADLEAQTSLLATRSEMADLNLSPLTRGIIDRMGSIDEVEAQEHPAAWISYISDSRRVLRPSHSSANGNTALSEAAASSSQ